MRAHLNGEPCHQVEGKTVKILIWPILMGQYKILGRWLKILGRPKQSSPGGSDGKCWADMSQSERD